MSIKKPLIYSGIAVSLGLSGGGLYRAKIEQARTGIREAMIAMNAARKEAESNAYSSTDSSTKIAELMACDAKSQICGTVSDANLGMRGYATSKAFAQCENIVNPSLHEACTGTVMRGLIGVALSASSDFSKCIQGVTECYEKVKKE